MKTIEPTHQRHDDHEAHTIDAIDRKIIVATQSGLPLVSRPYDAIAEQLGIGADEVKQRMQRMLSRGIIRRIAAVPNHYKLGYQANGMTVWNAPDDMVAELGKKIGELAVVSHCYHRPRYLPEWPYNLFAMVHAKTKAEVMQWVDEISHMLGEHDHGHDVLFSSRILKKTGLRLKGSED